MCVYVCVPGCLFVVDGVYTERVIGHASGRDHGKMRHYGRSVGIPIDIELAVLHDRIGYDISYR